MAVECRRRSRFAPLLLKTCCGWNPALRVKDVRASDYLTGRQITKPPGDEVSEHVQQIGHVNYLGRSDGADAAPKIPHERHRTQMLGCPALCLSFGATVCEPILTADQRRNLVSGVQMRVMSQFVRKGNPTKPSIGRPIEQPVEPDSEVVPVADVQAPVDRD
jgi:hypothetical protein